MKVRLLGTSAGGGFPQWNCACRGCQTARRDPALAKPRTQSSVAISADGRGWFLLNVSPDIRFQIEAFPALQSPAGHVRGTAIEGALLTNADLDHCLGLLLIREGERLAIHCATRVRESLQQGLAMGTLLEHYAGATWLEPPELLAPLLSSAGQPSGVRYAAFPVPGKPPRYLEGRSAPDRFDNLGYRFVDERTGGRLVFIPDCATIDAAVRAQIADCDVALIDGTFWSEAEMSALGGRTAAAMAHQPVGGDRGTLATLRELRGPRVIYLHINNTNPMLIRGSPEQLAVTAAGCEIGEDGQELNL
jgi:pyrroloquinoline quinone biosynthesis protein B